MAKKKNVTIFGIEVEKSHFTLNKPPKKLSQNPLKGDGTLVER